MKKVLLATLLAFVGLAVVADASAWCGRRRTCRRECAPVCGETRNCEAPCTKAPVAAVEVIENPCGPAPCCLTAVKVPAELVKTIDYHWRCPNGCVEQPGAVGTY